MDSDDVFSRLQEQIVEMHKREVANCEEINRLTQENLEYIQQAAKAKAYKKQIDSLLSDPVLVKMRMTGNGDEMEIENDAQLEEQNRYLLKKLKEVSTERDKYAQIADEQSFYQEQIAKKNKQIVELTDKLISAENSAEIYKKQLDEFKKNIKMSEDQDVTSKSRITLLEQENNKLEEILTTKVNELGSMTAINTELEMKNNELTKRLADAQTMIAVQQTESRMISDPLFDKEDLTKRITLTVDRVLGNANQTLDEMGKRVKVMERKVESIKSVEGGMSQEQQELIDDLTDQIRYLEENDTAPRLASSLKRIAELENEVAWLKSKE